MKESWLVSANDVHPESLHGANGRNGAPRNISSHNSSNPELSEAACSDRQMHGPLTTLEVSKLNLRLSDSSGEEARGSFVIRVNSQVMRQVIQKVKIYAPHDISVVIQGESGTGKELIARALHINSQRHKGPFIALNCGALPESLLESELFGHERGSFSGAVNLHRGCFERATYGTLFLDEIGDISQAAQVKLLRVLQEQEVVRVGGERPLRVDVRVIAATNKDLHHEMAKGNFREDLYYRLKGALIQLPPLRERREDIPVLLEHFLSIHGKHAKREHVSFSHEVLSVLENYQWPGNIRELENVVRHCVIACQGSLITLTELPPDLRDNNTLVASVGADLSCRSLEEEVAELKRNLIRFALLQTQGDEKKAAQLLGLTVRKIKYAIDKLVISRDKPG